MKNRFIVCLSIILSSAVFYCSSALAECSLDIQKSVISGWKKENVLYAVDKNTLKIKVGEGSKVDADSIYIGSIKGCITLTIDISNISGEYVWDGKVIGFSFFNDKLEPHQWGNQASFPAPRGRAIDDGFVKAGSSKTMKLVYDIANSAATTHIGAKVFIGSNNALELRFSAQDSSRDVQASARPPARPARRYAAGPNYRSDAAANSCSLSCHEPRTEHAEFEYSDDFTIPPSAYCPHERD